MLGRLLFISDFYTRRENLELVIKYSTKVQIHVHGWDRCPYMMPDEALGLVVE